MTVTIIPDALETDKVVTETTKKIKFGPNNGRITGHLTLLDAVGLYVLDFVRDDGKCIRGRPTVDVYDVSEGPRPTEVIAMGKHGVLLSSVAC